MKILSYFESVQGQRHDFINHLQVISGLLQLNKIEQAQSYVKRVGYGIANVRRTSHVSIPYLSLALLDSIREGTEHEVKVILTVESDFSGCGVQGPMIGEVIELLTNSALEALHFPDIADKCLNIILRKQQDRYTCRYVLPEPNQIALRMLERVMIDLEVLLSPHGALISWEKIDQRREIILDLPSCSLDNNNKLLPES